MIYTWSKFNYGQISDLSSQSLPFSEGANGPLLTAYIPIGSYTLGGYAQSIADAMTSVGTLNYSTTIDRTTNRITILASGVFSLKTSQSSTAYASIGFATNANLSGASAYTAPMPCGAQYYPQFRLQDYVPAENYAEAVAATINESASGQVEVVRFGVNRKIELNVKFITNLTMDGAIIRSNPRGLSDARAFLDFATSKAPFEFVPDVLNPSSFINVILDGTPGYKDGTGYKLKELYSDNVPDVYETGVITLRVI